MRFGCVGFTTKFYRGFAASRCVLPFAAASNIGGLGDTGFEVCLYSESDLSYNVFWRALGELILNRLMSMFSSKLTFLQVILLTKVAMNTAVMKDQIQPTN